MITRIARRTFTLVILALLVSHPLYSQATTAPPVFKAQWAIENGIPKDVAVDSKGIVYVTVDKTGGTLDSVATYKADGTLIAELFSLTGDIGGIAIDPDGNVLVTATDSHRVMQYSPEGQLKMEWGGEGSEPGRFVNPKGIAVDANGLLYVVDSGNKRIQVFQRDGAFVSQFAIEGGAPEAVALDAMSNVLVTISDNSVAKLVKYTSAGQVLKEIHTTEGTLGGVAVFGPTGEIFLTVAKDHRVMQFSVEGQLISQWGGEGSEAGQFRNPKGLGISKVGRIYIADSANNRIQGFLNAIAPEILSIEFPATIVGNGRSNAGRVQYRDLNGDLKWARFSVVQKPQGSVWQPFDELVRVPQVEGSVRFSIFCNNTGNPMQVTYGVTLEDQEGKRSLRKDFSFTCVRP